MVNHPFNKGKSAFKAKQYLACGVPVLANDVGETLGFVKDKFNGFICNNETEIINAIHEIDQINENDYNDLSNNCLSDVNSFSVERYSDILLDIK